MADPVFLITGASSGIGAATARHAARPATELVLAARSEDKLEALAQRARRAPGALRRDRRGRTSSGWPPPRSTRSAASTSCSRTPGSARRAASSSRHPSTGARWCSPTSTARRSRSAPTLPHVRETRGHVLLTGSVAGRRALPGSLYSATKWAVTAMGEALRQEVDGSGMRVTLIEPGMVDTPFFDNRPQGALEADDVARAVMFAVQQPPHVDVNEILVRPTAQAG